MAAQIQAPPFHFGLLVQKAIERRYELNCLEFLIHKICLKIWPNYRAYYTQERNILFQMEFLESSESEEEEQKSAASSDNEDSEKSSTASSEDIQEEEQKQRNYW